MTVDAAGGVWRYAMDLAAGLRDEGIETAFLGFGPAPARAARREAEALGTLDWAAAPLDWMAATPEALAPVPGEIAAAAARRGADLVQVNVPSQAAALAPGLPVVAVHHSCVTTWYGAVKGTEPPEGWRARLTRRGLDRAEAVVAPTAAHASAVRDVYGPREIDVVPNAVALRAMDSEGSAHVVASGRWWDEGKGGAILDAAAALCAWPVVMLGPAHAPGVTPFRARHATVAGPLPHATAAALVRSAGIFAAPALYEPFGLAVAEAARAARPLVLSDIATFRELWQDAAAFVPAGDPEALARTLDRLAADTRARRRLGHAAQARAASLTPAKQARAMAALYRSRAACRATSEVR